MDATERNEKSWVQGNRAAWTRMFEECLSRLGYDRPEATYIAWVAEREAVVAKLREVCDEHGDNDWQPKDNLADVIEKHLFNHIEAHRFEG